MSWCVLSLDVSASSTGWSVLAPKFGDYGIITTDPKMTRSDRLFMFRIELIKLILNHRPTHIVMEDTFSGLNPKTLKILSEFAGVAKEVCQEFAQIDPYVISTNTVKAYFKTKAKEDMFNVVVEMLDFDESKWNFKKDNDIIDAIAMGLCYADNVIGINKFRQEKEYGYIYNIGGQDGKKY